MVTKQRRREHQGGPPPMDESWWEAVLAEDEAQQTTASSRETGLARPVRPSQAELAKSVPASPETVDWNAANELYEKDQAIELLVDGYNRGGLLVSGENLKGFVPVSHLIEAPEDKEDLELWLSSYEGGSLRLKVIECDRERGRVVFSERAALAEPGSRNQLLNELRPGDNVFGNVTNITDFGVFVDLGGVEGLIHVSEISWGRVRHPSDVVHLGQQVRVFVIQVERDRARVALSLKRLYPNPWATAEARYFPGQIVEAMVTSIVPFGAFARLEEGLDGLIHISEMCPEGRVANPMEILREGQCLRVRVIHVDGSRQRLGLSMRLSDADIK